MSRRLLPCLRTQDASFVDDKENGWFLVSAIVMIMFLTSIGFSIAGLVAIQYQHTRREMYDQNAQLAAEAGIVIGECQAGDAGSYSFIGRTARGCGTWRASGYGGVIGTV